MFCMGVLCREEGSPVSAITERRDMGLYNNNNTYINIYIAQNINQVF